MTGKRGQYVGNGEMKCSTTEELSESKAEGEKSKKGQVEVPPEKGGQDDPLQGREEGSSE